MSARCEVGERLLHQCLNRKYIRLDEHKSEPIRIHLLAALWNLSLRCHGKCHCECFDQQDRNLDLRPFKKTSSSHRLHTGIMDSYPGDNSSGNNWQCSTPAMLRPAISLDTPFPAYAASRRGMSNESGSSSGSTWFSRSESPAVITRRSGHEECLARISELESERIRLYEQINQKNELLFQKSETIIGLQQNALQNATFNNRFANVNTVANGRPVNQGKLISLLTTNSNDL